MFLFGFPLKPQKRGASKKVLAYLPSESAASGLQGLQVPFAQMIAIMALEDDLKQKTLLGLGSPVVPFYPVFGEGSPTKIDYRKKGTLVLSSLLEDLDLLAIQTPCFSSFFSALPKMPCNEISHEGERDPSACNMFPAFEGWI